MSKNNNDIDLKNTVNQKHIKFYDKTLKTLELILDERARELVYEESRWNTLLRMGGTIAVERIKEYSYWDYPRTTLTENYNLWPIPQTVIDTNKDVDIEQNPGW